MYANHIHPLEYVVSILLQVLTACGFSTYISDLRMEGRAGQGASPTAILLTVGHSRLYMVKKGVTAGIFLLLNYWLDGRSLLINSFTKCWQFAVAKEYCFDNCSSMNFFRTFMFVFFMTIVAP